MRRMTDSLACIAGHSTRAPLTSRRPAADTAGNMVRFINRRMQEPRRLTVRRIRARSGHRLVVAYPGGLQRFHAFADDVALAAGTAALQAALAAEGWEPLHRPAPRWRPAAGG